MKGFGGMLSFELKGGLQAGRRFVENVQVSSHAASLGDVETIVNHSATLVAASLSAKEQSDAGISDGLIRVSVGIEDIMDLERDFENALAVLDPTVITR